MWMCEYVRLDSWFISQHSECSPSIVGLLPSQLLVRIYSIGHRFFFVDVVVVVHTKKQTNANERNSRRKKRYRLVCYRNKCTHQKLNEKHKKQTNKRHQCIVFCFFRSIDRLFVGCFTGPTHERNVENTKTKNKFRNLIECCLPSSRM